MKFKLYDFSRKGLLRLLIFGTAVLLITRFVFMPFHVSGYSMEPNCPDGSFAFVSAVSYLVSDPGRGDILVARTSRPPYMYILKRVIGLPGETVSIRSGIVFINGKRLREPYTKINPAWNLPPVHIGKDRYYLIGDNRNMPLEMHLHREVSVDNIIGEVVLFF